MVAAESCRESSAALSLRPSVSAFDAFDPIDVVVVPQVMLVGRKLIEERVESAGEAGTGEFVDDRSVGGWSGRIRTLAVLKLAA
jgi:hypothetical protein